MATGVEIDKQDEEEEDVDMGLHNELMYSYDGSIPEVELLKFVFEQMKEMPVIVYCDRQWMLRLLSSKYPCLQKLESRPQRKHDGALG